jgi:hypothetical protein
MAGVDLPTIGAMLGNETQLKRYTHLTDAHKRAAIQALDSSVTSHNQDTSAGKMLVENAV